jgi:hypothetical protein
MTMTNQHTDSVLIQQMEILKGDNTMTKTPDYNDGNVHFWKGDCVPDGLHEMTLIRIDSAFSWFIVGLVKEARWAEISAFQVIKQHVEPRAWWMNVYQDGSADLIHRTKEEAVLFSRGLHPTPFRTIRVIEQPESGT